MVATKKTHVYATAPTVPEFVLQVANGFVWNRDALIEFLIKHQHTGVQLTTRAEGACLAECGVYQLLDAFGYTDVTIVTHNALERHDRYQIIIPPTWSMFLGSWQSSFRKFHHWNKQYLFGCFYNRPLWHRLGLAAHLQTYHQDRTQLNIRCHGKDEDSRQLWELQTLFNLHPQSAKNLLAVMPTWPQQLEAVDGYALGTAETHTQELADFYPNILIDVVAETWTQGNCFYPTEKTTRPILLKKPFILMGPANYLLHLRQLGFKTFGDFWDEDYDGYSGIDRYQRILNLIDHLATQSQTQLDDLHNNIKPILDYNYNLLIKRGWKTDLSLLA